VVRRWIVAGVAALAISLVLAPTALAETFTVDSTGDAADDTIDGTCDADGGAPVVCTLRAAIQEANDETFNPGEDTIAFHADFNRELADTIILGSPLPAIVTDINIDGGNCPLSPLAPGPCAGVGYAAGPPAMLAFVVAADNVSIEGLAITNALVAVNVTTGSSGFEMHNNWIGLGLSFAPGTNGIGVLLGPDADAAAIGGHTSAERNIIVANGTGLDIEGADDAHLEGNWIGLAPNGTTVALNGENVEITGTTSGGGFDATGNAVGGLLGGGVATAACDEACNAIAGSPTNGIDLQGDGGTETPAGATTIQGNHIGLNALGTAAAGNATGIRVGDADGVTIGAPANLFATNYITGGATGVSAGAGADDLVVASNRLGLAPPTGNAALSPPSAAGIDVISPAANPVSITDNAVAMTSGVAVSVQGDNAEIDSNRIGRGSGGAELTGGNVGLRLRDAEDATVNANVVANTTAVGPAAVSIEGGGDHVLTDNDILNSGSIGLAISPFMATPSTGNTIGGDTVPEPNTITGSAGDAIEISGDGSDGNEILRNLGANSGLFIDLGADGLGNSGSGPNGGIQAPTVTAADDDSAEGTAAPGTTVRVFDKATAGNGEIEGFLGSALTDGAGNWQVTYATGIVGPFVGATQTDGTTGTSEMDVEETVIPDTTPPDTEITAAPKPKVKTRKKRKRVRFEFTASEENATFECSRDGGAFTACSSPFSYKAKRGKRTFAVRALDEVGNADETPATHAFKVKRKRKKK
jgi:hypothetical protein